MPRATAKAVGLVFGLSACIAHTDRSNQRAGVTGPPVKAAPGVPASPPPAPPAPAGPAPGPAAAGARLTDGAFQLTGVSCSDGKALTAPPVLTLTATGATGQVKEALGDACTATQGATLDLDASNALTVTLGTTTCDGVCPSACPAAVLGKAGGRVTAKLGAIPDGFTWTETGASTPVATACAAAVPAVYAFAHAAATGCQARWHRDGPAVHGDSFTVEGGTLHWSVAALAPREVRAIWTQTPFTGDVTVTVTYRSFAEGGRGGAFRAVLQDADQTGAYAYAAAGTTSTALGAAANLEAAATSDGTFDEATNAKLNPRTKPDGTLTFVKKGSDVTVTAQDAAGAAAYKGALTGTNFRIGLELLNAATDAALATPTSVLIDAVLVQDGAGKRLPASDAFACDSIAP